MNIKDIHFSCIPKYIKVNEIAGTELLLWDLCPDTSYSVKSKLKRVFINSFCRNRYILEKADDSKFFIFYGEWNFRKDHFKYISDFSKSFKNADFIHPIDKKAFEFNPFIVILNWFLIIIWLLQMIGTGYSFGNKLRIIEHLQSARYHLKLCKKFKLADYKFAVVYYDASPDENCIVQFCNNLNVTTMTLQHGIFAKKAVVKSLGDTALELSHSISDYYLAWNQYTKDEAIKVGVNPDKIVVLGVPKFINVDNPAKPLKSQDNTFGVILNNFDFDKHNRKLIDMANQISEKLGLKYVVRYHPALKPDIYKDLCGDNFIRNDNHKTIAEYAESVSFTIISSSSVFIDLLMLKHPVFRLCVNEDDTYSTVKFNSFNDVNKFVDVLNEQSEINNDAFSYLCTTYDVFESYNDFFNKILEER